MPAIDRLLKRWGFVKLSRYGLVLTPEGRIMSIRPEVLNDGQGGKIVGWQDDDPAALDLAPWAAARAVTQRTDPPAPVAAPTPARALVPQSSEVVARRAQVDEDEWEWEIALARARTAAEETELAARAPEARAPAPVPVRPAPAPARPMPAPSHPAPAPVRPMPAPTRGAQPAPAPAPTPARSMPAPVLPIALTEPTRRSAGGPARPTPDRPRPASVPPAPRGAPTPTPAPAPRGAPTPTPAPASSAPGSKPRRDEPASKLPPGGGNKPTKLSGVETEPIDWLQTDPTSVDRGDYLDPSGELLRAPSPERRIAARPMPAPSPEPIAPPRRFAAGTRPGGATKIGVMPAPPRLDDDYTMPNLSLGDSTVLDVSLSDRTNPGLAIGTARGVTATRPVAVPGLRNRPAR